MAAIDPPFDLLITANLATMTGTGAPYGLIENGAIGIKDGRIAAIWAADQIPGTPDKLATRHVSRDGCWLTPGLIDCHTHLVFGGNRAREFEMRLEGASYEEIATAGGGIMSTVRDTRAATDEELVQSGQTRLVRMMAEGVTTVEIKSGYGLDADTEMRMLRVAQALEETLPVRVRKTFLGAHALPPEYKADRTAYLDLVCNEMMPRIAEAGLADAVDAFCEKIGFTRAETQRVFEAARAHGLPVKLHAEQLSDSHGSQLAAEFGALSVDHLEYLSADGIDAIAASGTVAVLLPAAFYFLRETRLPPIEALREKGVAMALASDCNPGTAPTTAPLMVLNMACTLFRLTPEEALAGMTRHAARALGLQDEIGTLEVGKKADLALWDIGHPSELSYWMGLNPLNARVVDGELYAAIRQEQNKART